MGKIKVLDKETVNKISAGEVIERPASVVKELIENSLDSGADNIYVEVKDGGKKLIKVVDNGSGMSRDDLNICFFRHATSKLKDLFCIDTLGFRGEALSSIASVSNMKVCSNSSGTGNCVEVEAGKVLSEKEVGMSKGTTVEVKDIFFNTPARLKYLKSREVELFHITDLVTRYSLSNNDISFKLVSDSKEILNCSKTSSMINRIVDVYGKEVAKNMVKIDHKDGLLAIKGHIGKPYLTKNDRSMQSLFVNGRYVKSDIVNRAIYDAYHTLLFLDRHPVIIFNVEIDFSEVDVNVHPTKNLIRMEKENLIYESVFKAIRETFVKNDMIPDVSLDGGSSVAVKQDYGSFSEGRQTMLDTEKSNDSLDRSSSINKNFGHGKLAIKGGVSVEGIGPVKIIGQLNRMYIICESAKGLLIVDQHAAQERVNYEKFMKQYNNKNVVKQKLLRPMVIELDSKYHSRLVENKGLLENLGFELDDYGKNSVVVRQVPKLFGEVDKNLIIDIAGDLDNSSKMLDKDKEDKISRKACRSSVKAGKELTVVQMQEIVDKLNSCDNPFSCPHGRPTIINLSLGDLEKKFKRIA